MSDKYAYKNLAKVSISVGKTPEWLYHIRKNNPWHFKYMMSFHTDIHRSVQRYYVRNEMFNIYYTLSEAKGNLADFGRFLAAKKILKNDNSYNNNTNMKFKNQNAGTYKGLQSDLLIIKYYKEYVNDDK